MTESNERLERAAKAYEHWGDISMDQTPSAVLEYIEALEEALALRTPSDGVKVKPLEWTSAIPGRMFADIYMIERLYLDDWRLMLRANEHGNWPKFIAGPFTLDEAKAAAQADYNARILSALTGKE